MHQDLFPRAWLINTLLDEGFIAQKSAELAQPPVPCRRPVPQPDDEAIRAENNKTVARLYGTSNAEFTHLLRSFKGMATKRPEYLALLV